MTIRRLIIAEKGSVAKAIAGLLPGARTRDGNCTFVGDTAIVPLAGHFLELAPPKHYRKEWEKWDVANLPYRLTAGQWTNLPRDDSRAKSTIKQIRSILKEGVQEVVHAGDPDREGQLIVDELLEHVGWRGRTLRILPNANDDAAMRRCLSQICDNAKFEGLLWAAQCRQRADWLVGMNLTMAATKWLGQDQHKLTVNTGRVLTPTTALLVQRDLLIEGFVPRNFYNLVARVEAAGSKLDLSFAPNDEAKRIWDESLAKQIVSELAGQRTKLAVTKKKVAERPPKLFTLRSLQGEMGKRFKWGVHKVMEVAEALYLAGYTTYPRTESEYLQDEHAADIGTISGHLLSTGVFDALKPLKGSFKARDYVFNSAKAPVHHAIIPTAKPAVLSALKPDEAKLYQVIAERYLMCLLPDNEVAQTVISFSHNGRVFSAKGEAQLNGDQSWRVLAPKKSEKAVPNLDDGVDALIKSVAINAGKTTPPDRYTETTLVEDMGSVAKFVKDERLRKVLTETSGIGTSATQTATIERMKECGYAVTVKGVLLSTTLARTVIEAMPLSIKDPGLTALWEMMLKRVEEKEMRAEDFMARIDDFVGKTLAQMKDDQGRVRIQNDRNPPAQSLPASRRPSGTSSHARKASQ